MPYDGSFILAGDSVDIELRMQCANRSVSA